MSPERMFEIPTFERITPDLTGAERLAVFLGLPVDMQNAAWAELSDRIEAQSRERFVVGRLGSWATPAEISDEIALIWHDEIKHTPLATPMAIRTSRALPRATQDDDVLMEISPRVYVSILVGEEIGRDGKVRCPFHGGGDERTPSLHAYDAPEDGWYCFGCQRGGTIIDLAAEIYGIEPRGRGFHEIRRRLATDLGGVS